MFTNWGVRFDIIPTMQTPTETIRILAQVDLSQKAGRDVLSGFLSYASSRPNWEIRIHNGHPINNVKQLPHRWLPHAIITDRDINKTLLAKMRKGNLAGIVALHDDRSEGLPVRYIACNNAAIGKAGAEYFIKKKFKAFAYVPAFRYDGALKERQDAFVNRLKSDKHAVYVYSRSLKLPECCSTDQEHLAAWIRQLPKPCGIMADFDQRAKNILDACRSAKIDIPAMAFVLGVDDEEWLCENTIPTLSSILPDFRSGGIEAGRWIDKLLADGKVPMRSTFSYGMKRLVQRASTTDISGRVRAIILAVEFISRHFFEPISVSDIAAAAGTSVRLLQKHFKDCQKTSIARTLMQTRLAKVVKLLEETTTPISMIAQMTGFRDDFYLKRVFKREFNMTMREYRANVRAYKKESTSFKATFHDRMKNPRIS